MIQKKVVLIHPTQKNAGLFSYIWETMRNIFTYYDYPFYIYFGKQCSYYDINIKYTNNVWQYYFQQPSIQLMPTQQQKLCEVGISLNKQSEYRDYCIENNTQQGYQNKRDIYHQIINKNIILLPNIKKKIQTFYEEKLINKNVLGLHCRGTDHPQKKDMREYIPTIKKMLKNYDCIFATSDQQSRIDFLERYFGDSVITYPIQRSNSQIPLHYGNFKNKYQKGEDILVESYLLSKTNFLLMTSGSNVNFFVRALNNKLNFIDMVNI